MEPMAPPPPRSEPKVIPIQKDHFSFANIEAWLNIIRSYQQKHPEHKVHIVYEGEEIQSRMSLFRVEKPVNPEGFEFYVVAEDKNFKDLPKLFRLLVEGAGPEFNKFVPPELHRTLELF